MGTCSQELGSERQKERVPHSLIPSPGMETNFTSHWSLSKSQSFERDHSKRAHKFIMYLRPWQVQNLAKRELSRCQDERAHYEQNGWACGVWIISSKLRESIETRQVRFRKWKVRIEVGLEAIWYHSRASHMWSSVLPLRKFGTKPTFTLVSTRQRFTRELSRVLTTPWLPLPCSTTLLSWRCNIMPFVPAEGYWPYTNIRKTMPLWWEWGLLWNFVSAFGISIVCCQ